MEKENKWGGKRAGSGRKPKNCTSVAFRLDNELLSKVVVLTEQRGCSKTAIIEEALRAYFSKQ